MLILFIRGKNTKKYNVFKKLVSNLAYSPALIEDIGVYANRLKREELIRKTTLLFIVLTLILQSFVFFSPPDSVNASNKQDLVHGGIRDLNDFLSMYDRNDQDIKDILLHFNIKREDIENARPINIQLTPQTYELNRYGMVNSPDKEALITYKRSSGGTDTRYLTLLSDTKNIRSVNGWESVSTSFGWFGISKTNGSLLMKGLPPKIRHLSDSSAPLQQSISIRNLTQDDDLKNIVAESGDRIEYRLQITNIDNSPTLSNFFVRIDDLLEYGSVIDSGGGLFDDETKTLTWPQIKIAPDETQVRTFVIKMAPKIPLVPKGQSNPSSHDCMMTIVFGEKKSLPVDCPLIKNIELSMNILPSINRGAILAFIFTVVVVSLYLYMRTKQLRKELRILRHNFNNGVI